MPTTAASPVKAARLLLEEAWTPPGGVVPLPVDSIAIARSLGLEVYTAGLPDDVSGLLVKKANESASIYLNRDNSYNRQRFTCAHEIGHFVKLRPSITDSFEFVERRDGRSAQGTEADEIYANRFAAELLMPDEEVRRLHAQAGPGKIARLARQFGVSELSMDYRLRNLGLTSL